MHQLSEHPRPAIEGLGAADGGAKEIHRALIDRAAPGVDPEDADMFARVLAITVSEWRRGRGALPDLIGLDLSDLKTLRGEWFPKAPLPNLDRDRRAPLPDQAAIALLLKWKGGSRSPVSHWLADIVARRALEPNHLWQDLGLPSRAALGTVMLRHFPRIVALNDRKMRWKKFFYRQVCQDTGHTMCLSPVCDDCSEFESCFADEDGMARIDS
ncbi:MAG: nitrogen fixation protein NifQ [Filomicrobium sp.]